MAKYSARRAASLPSKPRFPRFAGAEPRVPSRGADTTFRIAPAVTQNRGQRTQQEARRAQAAAPDGGSHPTLLRSPRDAGLLRADQQTHHRMPRGIEDAHAMMMKNTP